MPTKKRSWKAWAVDYVRRTQTCPGDAPPMGLPTDMLTEEEFALSLRGSKLHPHRDCHLVEDILGLPDPGTEVGAAVEPRVTEADVERLQHLAETQEVAQIVEEVKKQLHVYVDLIALKEEGVLYIPEPLLKLQSYINTFFETE